MFVICRKKGYFSKDITFLFSNTRLREMKLSFYLFNPHIKAYSILNSFHQRAC